MTAATIVGSAAHHELDPSEIRRELSRLHILLLSVKADVDDALSPAAPARAAADLKSGLKQAFSCLNALRERLAEA